MVLQPAVAGPVLVLDFPQLANAHEPLLVRVVDIVVCSFIREAQRAVQIYADGFYQVMVEVLAVLHQDVPEPVGGLEGRVRVSQAGQHPSQENQPKFWRVRAIPQKPLVPAVDGVKHHQRSRAHQKSEHVALNGAGVVRHHTAHGSPHP